MKKISNNTILEIFAIKLEKHNYSPQVLEETIEILRPILIWAEDKEEVCRKCEIGGTEHPHLKKEDKCIEEHKRIMWCRTHQQDLRTCSQKKCS
jgi:hypothetical protein